MQLLFNILLSFHARGFVLVGKQINDASARESGAAAELASLQKTAKYRNPTTEYDVRC